MLHYTFTRYLTESGDILLNSLLHCSKIYHIDIRTVARIASFDINNDHYMYMSQQKIHVNITVGINIHVIIFLQTTQQYKAYLTLATTETG